MVSISKWFKLLDAVVDSDRGKYLWSSVVYGLVVIAMPSLSFIRLDNVKYVLTGSKYYLYSLASLLNSPSFLILVGVVAMLPAMLLLTSLGRRNSSFIICNSPVGRGDFLASSYTMAALYSAISAVFALIYWGGIRYFLMVCRVCGPLELGAEMALLTLALTLPMAIYGSSVAAIIASSFRYDGVKALTALAIYAIASGFIIATIHSIAGNVAWRVVASVLFPCYGLMYATLQALGAPLTINIAGASAALTPFAINLMCCGSVLTLVASAALAIESFRRYGEVRAA